MDRTSHTPANRLIEPQWAAHPAAPAAGTILLCGLLTLAAALLLGGYSYGTEDHLGLLPMFKAMARPGLYEHDWYIQAERQMNVRLFYLHFLAWLAGPIGLPAASFLLYAACCVGLYAALVKLSLVFIKRPAAALLAAAAAMLSPVALELGHSKLLSNQMLPNLLAYALVAWALYAAIRDRPITAGLCLGVATLMQGLVGILAAVLVFATLLSCHWHSWRRRWAAWLIGGLTCLASAAPNIALVLSAESTRELGNRSLEDFFIYAKLRVPHHVLPLTWPASAWWAGGLLLVFILITKLKNVGCRMSDVGCEDEARTPPPTSDIQHPTSLLPPPSAFWTPVILILASFAVGVVFVNIIPTMAVAKLHLFRGMTFFRLFAIIALFQGLERISQSRLTSGRIHAVMLAIAFIACLHDTLWLVVAPYLVIRIAASRPIDTLPAGSAQRSLLSAMLNLAGGVVIIIAILHLAAEDLYAAKLVGALGVALLLTLITTDFVLSRASAIPSNAAAIPSKGGGILGKKRVILSEASVILSEAKDLPAPHPDDPAARPVLRCFASLSMIRKWNPMTRTWNPMTRTRTIEPLRRWASPIAAIGMALAFLLITPFPTGALGPARLVNEVWRQFRMAVPDDRPHSAAHRAGLWASTHLPPDAVVLIEPWMKDFRYRSERAVVVDFKGVPFTTEGLRQWCRRVYDVCGLPSASIETQATPPDLCAAFSNLGGAALADKAIHYGADYLAVSRDVDGPWRLLHRDKDQRIYALVNVEAARASW